MDAWGWTVQLLNGWAGASSLFLVAAGLSLIFGVTRIVNFAHGSFFLLGIYLAYSLVEFISRPLGQAWVDHILAHPAMRQWEDEALRESWREVSHEEELRACGEVIADYRIG